MIMGSKLNFPQVAKPVIQGLANIIQSHHILGMFLQVSPENGFLFFLKAPLKQPALDDFLGIQWVYHLSSESLYNFWQRMNKASLEISHNISPLIPSPYYY